MAPTIGRYERWAAYVTAELAKRGWTNAEYARRHGNGLAPSVVSRWTNPTKRLAPSPKVAFRVAETFDVAPAVVLREAGHDEVADVIEDYAATLGAGRTPTGALDRLYAAGLDPKTARALAEDYQRSITAAERKLDLEIEAAQHRKEKPAGRRAQARADAETWRAWITTKVAETAHATGQDITTDVLVALSEGDITTAAVEAWEAAKRPATPTEARLAAVLLADHRLRHGIPTPAEEFHRDSVDALRAAGHHDVADIVEQVREATPSRRASAGPREAGGRAS